MNSVIVSQIVIYYYNNIASVTKRKPSGKASAVYFVDFIDHCQLSVIRLDPLTMVATGIEVELCSKSSRARWAA